MPHLLRHSRLHPARVRRRRLPGVFLLCAAIMWGLPLACPAQDDFAFHSCTASLGGGWTPRTGTDASSLNAGWNFQAGGGFAVWSRSTPLRKTQNHNWWALFIGANFMFDRMGVTTAALQQARISNPTNVGLLEATSARARFFSMTLDPTLRIPITPRVSLYGLGGFGWFRRSIVFTGASSQGALLEPGAPAVFGSGGNSGAYDFGGGINVRPWKRVGLTIYAEARFIRGLAVNNASTLVPLSAGVRW